MITNLWKRLVGGLLTCAMLLTYPAAYAIEDKGTAEPITASDDYILIDDSAMDKNQENYFEYYGGEDEGGAKGWSSKPNTDKAWSCDEIGTQHWVWTNTADAAKYTYSFTFMGTGVELIGIKSDEYMKFQLDDQAEEVLPIAGTDGAGVTLYKKDGLPYRQHTVHVSMPTDKGGNGLQVSCAMDRSCRGL